MARRPAPRTWLDGTRAARGDVPTGRRPPPYDVVVEPLADAIDGILRAGRRLGARGLISAGEGNLSIRLDADRLLTTPTGLRKDELTPDDLVVVWIDHPEREAVSRSGHGPSSDLAIHRAVHRARRDIGAVAHAHLPASMGLTLAGEIPDPSALPETALLLAAPAVPLPRRARQRGAGRADRRSPVRGPGAARERGPPRAAWRGRGRARSRPCGGPARARRGPLSHVARCAFDSRRAPRCGYG